MGALAAVRRTIPVSQLASSRSRNERGWIRPKSAHAVPPRTSLRRLTPSGVNAGGRVDGLAIDGRWNAFRAVSTGRWTRGLRPRAAFLVPLGDGHVQEGQASAHRALGRGGRTMGAARSGPPGCPHAGAGDGAAEDQERVSGRAPDNDGQGRATHAPSEERSDATSLQHALNSFGRWHLARTTTDALTFAWNVRLLVSLSKGIPAASN